MTGQNIILCYDEPMNNIDSYLVFAKDLAYQAGDIMRANFKPGVASETKSDMTPVTIADTQINKMVIDAVAEKFPDHSVMGEEESSTTQNTEYLWVCDPIDGTIPYTLGIPANMFSLALVHNGESILGVLYDPYTDRLYEAVKGNGAFMNGQKIRVNQEVAPKGYITMPTMQYGLTNNADMVHDAITMGIRSFSVCCVTYEAMLIANGQITGAIFPGNTPWDIAACKVIVEEAGGVVTNLDGEEQKYDCPIRGAVMSNGVMHDELVALAQRNLVA